MKSLGTKHYIIPIFIPHHSCPHRCVFCNQSKITGQRSIPSPYEVEKIILQFLSTIPKGNRIIEIAFFGGSFTGIDPEMQEHYLQVAEAFIDNERISSIRVSTRPDYIDDRRLNLLNKYHVKTIELGAQSMDDRVLAMAGRGHSALDTVNASMKIRQHGFSLGLQMMIGLPGDTLPLAIFTAEKIVELGAESTRIYPTLVIRDTKLAELYLKGLYLPLSLEVAVDWCRVIYPLFEKAGVTVLRIGLHPSEGLISGNDLIAGPFHPSFRELVMSRLWNEELKNIENKDDKKNIIIVVNPAQLNFAIGYGGKNRKMLQERFEQVKFITNPLLKGRCYNVDHC
ncbi:MAG: radical SAM protein [Bacteroidetes bacterium]|nr:radical SAM protein [Bacteroidota bacterium]